MSAAAADAAATAPAGGGKKKLIIIVAAALVLLLGGGGAAFMLLKPKPHAEDGAEGDGHGAPKAKSKAKAEEAEARPAPRARTHDPKNPPVFVPLDPFTVNLADRDSERYAQIGVTLELDDPKIGEELKIYMPAIRNNILMVISGKTADKLATREGKEKLARQILHATVRPLGFPTIEEDDEEEVDAHGEPVKKKKKRRQQELIYPVVAVHFSTFIVQ